MATAVVRVQTPEEREYARFLTQVEARRRRVADLRTEIETLKRELARFDAEYHAQVGRRFIELDQVRLAIDEYERRIAWLKWHPDADPAAMEREIREAFAKRKQELEAAAEAARRRAEEQARLRRPPLDPENAIWRRCGRWSVRPTSMIPPLSRAQSAASSSGRSAKLPVIEPEDVRAVRCHTISVGSVIISTWDSIVRRFALDDGADIWRKWIGNLLPEEPVAGYFVRLRWGFGLK